MALNQLLLLLCSLLFFILTSMAKTSSSRPNALVLPVSKDWKTLQYLVQIYQRTPLVPVKLTLDVNGEFLWVDCEKGYVSSSYKPVPCNTTKCSLTGEIYCKKQCSTPRIGCHNNTCTAIVFNWIKRFSSIADFGLDIVTIQSTDGSNPGKVVPVKNFPFACGFTELLQGVASGVTGIAGLAQNMASIPWQLSAAFSFPKKFAMCLSSSSNAKGVIFFGGGPYNLLPGIDASKSLIYTPLIKNNKNKIYSNHYFIGVKSIEINGKKVALNETLLSFDKEGKGGTKISTIDPYTVMESSIYKAVTEAFADALSGIPRAPSVAPFSLCYDSNKIRSTGVSPAVPHIDLVLQSRSVVWRIYGANSMVQAAKNVLCLGFVDKSVLSIKPVNAIVLGGHQLEDNLIQVDLSSSKLGFSSSLLFRQKTCSNFNFTSKAQILY